MSPDSSLFIKRIHRLSQALIISGALNIGVLSMLLYWMLRERPPTPYCELKPASFEQQQIPLADQRGCPEVLTQLSQLSVSQLINRLSHTRQIENGYAERDLALACLMAFHHFDIQRALPKNAQPQQKRLLAWKPKGEDSSATLIVYPDLTQQQFDSLIKFAKNERWPFTAQGLFSLLQVQKEKNDLNETLIETFVLTPEFWTVELLFNRSGQHANKQEILTLLLEGNWIILKQFVDQQRQVHDSSDARRQKFLLDYLKEGSQSAAILLLKIEWDFSVKKLNDQQAIAILQLMPTHQTESMQFAKEMLLSPRSTKVWQQASQWLYTCSGEPMPKKWNHQEALARFVSEKPINALISKPIGITPIASPLPMVHPKVMVPEPIKSAPPPQIAPIATKQPSINRKILPPSPAKLCVYVIQERDSLWKIARRFGVKVEELKVLNEMKSDLLKPGTTLKIPDADKNKKQQDRQRL